MKYEDLGARIFSIINDFQGTIKLIDALNTVKYDAAISGKPITDIVCGQNIFTNLITGRNPIQPVDRNVYCTIISYIWS